MMNFVITPFFFVGTQCLISGLVYAALAYMYSTVCIQTSLKANVHEYLCRPL